MRSVDIIVVKRSASHLSNAEDAIDESINIIACGFGIPLQRYRRSERQGCRQARKQGRD